MSTRIHISLPVSDPDGNAWEVWVRTGEAEQMRSRRSECCAAA